MNKLLSIALGVAFSTSALSANDLLKTTEQQASYTLATDLAKNFNQQGLSIDLKAFTLGLEDVMKNRPLQLTEQQMMEAVNTVKKEIMQKQHAKRQAMGLANLKEGQEFLASNAKKSGVKTLESGVQYKVITEGKGKSPTEDDIIFANYRGSLINGTEFDSSYKRGAPLKFQMSNVIKGWGEVLKRMKPGAKWEVYIPSNMAYGEKGAGNLIGPNQTLIFTIELVQFDTEKTQS